jgi:ATP-binding cassette, subfamily B, bacterial IrtA/YbtP
MASGDASTVKNARSLTDEGGSDVENAIPRDEGRTTEEQGNTRFRDLGMLMHPVRGPLVVVGLINVFSALIALVPYVAVAWLVQRLLDGTLHRDAMIVAVASILISLVLRQLMYMGSLGYAHIVDAKLRRSVRQRILDHMGEVPLGNIVSRSSGELRHLVVDDAAAIHTIVAHVVAEGSSAISGIVASTVLLFVASWQLAVGYALMFLLVAAISKLLAPRHDAHTREDYAHAQSELAADAVELTEGIAEIKGYGMTGGFMQRFHRSLDRFSDASYRGTVAVARPMSLLTTVVLPGILLGPMLLLCWCSFTMQWSSIFGIAVFLFVGLGVPQTFFGSLSLVQNVTLGMEAAGRIVAFLDEDALREPANASPFGASDARSDIIFDHVSFGYDRSHDVLHDVSLRVPAGSRTALVGPSGSGKTTVTRLLARFWEVQRGHIRIGSRDISTISSKDLLAQIGFVFQDMMLASVSIRENIRFACPEASDEAVVEAAKKAHIHQRIMSLAHGYDTIIGSPEAQLSGGERQRLCIARVFLQNAPILVMDEPTASLDAENEALLDESFTEFSRQRITITVAHRLSTIVDSDLIVVLCDGKVTQQGSHQELVSQVGEYRSLWQAQMVKEVR